MAIMASTITPVGGEVEEVPYMRRPEPGARLNHAQHVLVIQRLVFLGVVALFRMRGMKGGVGVRAVLGKADDPVGVFGVVLVEELVRLRKLPEVPAEVEVIAVDVGNGQNGAVDLQHEDVRHRGQAGGIETVAQLVQRPVIIQQLLIDRAGGGDLVGQPPDSDDGEVGEDTVSGPVDDGFLVSVPGAVARRRWRR